MQTINKLKICNCCEDDCQIGSDINEIAEKINEIIDYINQPNHKEVTNERNEGITKKKV